MSDTTITMIVVVILYFLGQRVFHAMMQKYSWQFWYHTFYLNSIHWRFLKWRKRIWVKITTGKVACEKSGSTKNLHFHHVHYKSLWHEKLSDIQIISKEYHRKGSGRI